jgi:tetratricopeptide (TPR) repeat protein
VLEEKVAKLVDWGKPKEAVKIAKEEAVKALSLVAGVYLTRLDNLNEAIKSMELAIQIQPDNPIGYSNLCSLLSRAEKLNEAVEIGKKGVLLPDATADMWYNYGVACKNISSLQESANAFRRARDMNPQCAMTRCQLANVLLALGEFEEGLKEDEWRFKAHSGLASCRKRYEKPDWDGKIDIKGKKLVVFNEQGLGDAIQFLRYLKPLKEKGPYIILEIQPPLVQLLKSCPWADEVVPSYDHSEKPQLPNHDLVVSIGSLPYLLDSDLKNTPMEVPYIWPTGNIIDLIEPFKGKKICVGIVWAGSQWHSSDRTRSCFLKHFRSLSDLKNVQLFSLQQGDMVRTWAKGKSILWQGNDDIEVVDLTEDSDGIDYIDLAPFLKDFNDTALAMQQLDLVIAVDTSVTHLAGALGIKTWLLLPWAHEWRWLKNWYSNMRIFRQPSPGDWSGLLYQVHSQLDSFSLMK